MGGLDPVGGCGAALFGGEGTVPVLSEWVYREVHSALCTMYTHQQYDLNFYVYTSQGNTQEMLVRNLFLCLVELVSELGVV